MAGKKIKSKTDQRPFVIIYHDFLESDILDTHYQKLIYIYLKKFADSNNQCFPSLKTLSELTKIGKTKVRETLKELESKGVLIIENRNKDNGGKASNLYTLKDYAEIWQNEEIVQEDKQEVTAEEHIKALKAMGYNVDSITKEKGAVHGNTGQSDHTEQPANKKSKRNYNTKENEESQERYSIELIKKIYAYDILIEKEAIYKKNVDIVISILYDTLNTSKKTIRIAGENRPAQVVISKLLKLDQEEILYAIKQYNMQTEKITNPTRYMLTLLYNAKEQYDLYIQNKVQRDMYNIIYN